MSPPGFLPLTTYRESVGIATGMLISAVLISVS